MLLFTLKGLLVWFTYLKVQTYCVTTASLCDPWGQTVVCCSCLVAQLYLTLLWPRGPPGSSVHGIPQARILEWVAVSSSRGSSQPRGQTCISYIGRQILYHWATWEAWSQTAGAHILTLLVINGHLSVFERDWFQDPPRVLKSPDTQVP